MHSSGLYILVVCITSLLVLLILFISTISFIQAQPAISDPNLKLEKLVGDLEFPTSLAFLGEKDFLVAEKDTGRILRITNDTLLPEPVLDANVSYGEGMGMLGIASLNTINQTYVFVSLIESPLGNDSSAYDITPLGNRLYRYELTDDKLQDPHLLFELPAFKGGIAFHYGGSITIGPDRLLYYVTGDNGPVRPDPSKSINLVNGTPPIGTAGILRMNIDGTAKGNGTLGQSYPTNLYFAYGIRNSFGLAFDPLTGNLWDTENGPESNDEINLVMEGFNSGWDTVMGKFKQTNTSAFDPSLSADSHDNLSVIKSYPSVRFDPSLSSDSIMNSKEIDGLEDFNGKGKYSDPEFVWKSPVAPTGIAFLNSTGLGQQYYNEMVVGDLVNGRLYHFKLTENRTSLEMPPGLADGEVKGSDMSSEDYQKIVLADGFGGITDLKVGPDGHLYVVSHFDGTIYRVGSH